LTKTEPLQNLRAVAIKEHKNEQMRTFPKQLDLLHLSALLRIIFSIREKIGHKIITAD
jgi:hypothetical protein